MNNLTMIFNNGLKNIGKFCNKYSSQILTGCGIAGFGTSMYLIAKESPKAKMALAELHRRLGEDDTPYTKNQILWKEIKTVAPIYAPSIATAIGSTACIISANKIETNKTAIFATAYETAQAGYLEYKNAVKEQLGEKKEKEVRHAIAQKKIDDNPPPNSGSEVMMTDGKSLFKFECDGRYFRSTRDDILKTAKYFSERLMGGEDWISFNEFCYELDISPTSNGEKLGFTDRYGIDISFDACITPEGGTCQVVSFSPDLMPRVKYF